MESTRGHSRYASHAAAMPPEAATSDKAGPGKPDGAGAAMVIDGQSSGRQRAGACSARASGSTAKDQPPVAGEPAKRGARPPGRGAGTIGGAIARIAAQEFLREVRAIISRSEEHTSELQSLMRTSYAVFCLKKKQEHTR